MTEVLKFAKSLGYEGVIYLKNWNGWECYEPILSDDGEIQYVGLPLVVMKKGNTIRMSTPEESLKI